MTGVDGIFAFVDAAGDKAAETETDHEETDSATKGAEAGFLGSLGDSSGPAVRAGVNDWLGGDDLRSLDLVELGLVHERLHGGVLRLGKSDWGLNCFAKVDFLIFVELAVWFFHHHFIL